MSAVADRDRTALRQVEADLQTNTRSIRHFRPSLVAESFRLRVRSSVVKATGHAAVTGCGSSRKEQPSTTTKLSKTFAFSCFASSVSGR